MNRLVRRRLISAAQSALKLRGRGAGWRRASGRAAGRPCPRRRDVLGREEGDAVGGLSEQRQAQSVGAVGGANPYDLLRRAPGIQACLNERASADGRLLGAMARGGLPHRVLRFLAFA